MPLIKQIVCLANSRMPGGTCIAGREFTASGEAGDWIRPVSAQEDKGIPEKERRYEDGSDPKVLDLISIPVRRPQPQGHQSENWRLDTRHQWTRSGRYPWDNLSRLLDTVSPLWTDGYSTNPGSNDRVPRDAVASLSSSLRLIHVDILDIIVLRPGEGFGNPSQRVQGRFQHAGTQYAMWITDPKYEERYIALGDKEHQIRNCFVTVSLGKLHKGYAYKLIAAIIERE